MPLLPTGGGPGDIMVRTGQISDDDSTGLRPEDMLPAVDDDCRAIDYPLPRNLTMFLLIISAVIPFYGHL